MRSVFLRTLCVLALISLVALPLAAQAGGPNITIPNADLGYFPIGTVQIPLRATGTGTLTWSTSGTLPPGLVLRTDDPGFFPIDANTGLIGVATTPGDYVFGVNVMDSTGTAATSDTVHNTNENIQESSSLPAAIAGQSYFFPKHKQNRTTPQKTLVGCLPQGIENM